MAGSKIVDAGFAIETNLISGLGGTVPKFLQWGTGTTNPAAGNTALETAANEARVSGTPTRTTTNVTNDTYTVTGTITSAAVQAITEAGLFDAAGSGTPAAGGNMFGRTTFAAINLSIGDSIAFTANTVFTSGT